VCVPNRSTKSAVRRREKKKRWFRNGQKKRWVGLGVIADYLISMANAMPRQANISGP
jgi:IS5 family transposase